MTGDKVKKEDMTFSQLSDLEMASKVRMLMRGDLEHEAVCVGARDRIMYLSQQVEAFREVLGRIVGEMPSIDDTTDTQNRMWAINQLAKDALAKSIR